MTRVPIGDQELALLQYVATRGPLSVGEAAESFGAERGWARSTVLTVMERLRQKGYLTRRRAAGVFRYASPVPAEELLRGVVESFVEKTLGGSLGPFATYLAEGADVSDDELRELEDALSRLQAKRQRDAGRP